MKIGTKDHECEVSGEPVASFVSMHRVGDFFAVKFSCVGRIDKVVILKILSFDREVKILAV